ncbi:hypothetical protein QWI18_25565 [Pseudomonas sp. W2Oct36]|uniref:hypothetical protein n=1 Tax=Pseudomonas sp. W2Oct36 TaxID=1215284 RepID=UPI0034E0CB08
MTDENTLCEVVKNPAAGLASRTAGMASTTVDIYDGDVKVGTAPVVDGAWQYTASSLAEGDHHFTARLDVLRSNSWHLTIRNALQLTAPGVVEVFMDSGTGFGNSLNLLKSINSATVIVKYPGMETGDQVTMSWNGAGGSTSETKLAGSSGDVSFVVPKTYITSNTNQRVRVSYTVVPVGATNTVNSPEMVFEITNSSLVGNPYFVEGFRTSRYRCTFSSGEIVVSNSTSPGTRLGSTPNAGPSAETRFTATETTSTFMENKIGAQPWRYSAIYPTNVPGIGFKLIDDRGTILEAGPGNRNGAGLYGNPGTTMRVEFFKTGFVEPGTIPAGDVVDWRFGANRLHYMSVYLTNAIKIVVT